MLEKTKIKHLLFILHLLIGYTLANFYPWSYLLSTFIFIISFLLIILTQNRNNQVLYWSFYLISFEVLFRMTKALFFYESVKYWVIFLLFIGWVIEKRKKNIHPFFLFYLIILFFSIIYTQIPYDANFRKSVLFNLSGPLVLAFSFLYNFNRIISYKQILQFLHIAGLPIISMLVFLYLKTPNLSEINFTTSANFATSGGFGPNQVSTILGFGIFIFIVLIINKYSFSGLKVIDYIILAYIIYRGFLTFSRGGIWTAATALIVFMFFYFRSNIKMFKTSIKYYLASIVFLFFVWQYTVYITDGMIINRYLGKNSAGIENKDFTSGRLEIFETEWEIFLKNPFIGGGAGSAKYLREKYHPNLVTASHSEISRLIAEHGALGIIIILSLLIIPLKRIHRLNKLNKAFLSAFFLFWFLTINHSAMRIAFPGFIYGLSLIIIYHEKNSLYRK